MKEFPIGWRFLEEKFELNVIRDEHKEELKPLNKIGSKFLNNYISTCQIHNDFPLKKGLFNIEKIQINDNEKEIKKWLYQRGISFDKKVYLSWDDNCGMVTKWKFVIKYWNSLFYDGHDDLTVFDESLEWILLFFHNSEIFYGTKKKFKLQIKQ